MAQDYPCPTRLHLHDGPRVQGAQDQVPQQAVKIRVTLSISSLTTAAIIVKEDPAGKWYESKHIVMMSPLLQWHKMYENASE